MAVILVFEPLHIVDDTGVTVGTGIGFTVMRREAELAQPKEVPVTVYVVLVPALQLTVAPVVALNPVEGTHE